ncbi:MAG: hypothetical protein WAM42_09330 [Candidatus Nitrosopolaris sp.]
MSDPNMITAYSWAAGLFKQVLPLSLVDIQKRAKLMNEINSLRKSEFTLQTHNAILNELYKQK